MYLPPEGARRQLMNSWAEAWKLKAELVNISRKSLYVSCLALVDMIIKCPGPEGRQHLYGIAFCDLLGKVINGDTNAIGDLIDLLKYLSILICGFLLSHGMNLGARAHNYSVECYRPVLEPGCLV